MYFFAENVYRFYSTLSCLSAFIRLSELWLYGILIGAVFRFVRIVPFPNIHAQPYTTYIFLDIYSEWYYPIAFFPQFSWKPVGCFCYFSISLSFSVVVRSIGLCYSIHPFIHSFVRFSVVSYTITFSLSIVTEWRA